MAQGCDDHCPECGKECFRLKGHNADYSWSVKKRQHACVNGHAWL